MEKQHISDVWDSGDKCEKCAIRNMVLFADLTRKDFELIHEPIESYELRVEDVLYDADDPADFVFTLRSGLIKLVSYLPDGGYRIVRILKQGDVAGLEALTENSYLHQAVVLEVASLCRIPVDLINKLNDNTPHLSKQLTTRWQKVMSDANFWLSRLTVGLSKQRVASLLLHLVDKHRGEECYLPSRDDMGAILSLAPETTSRVIADFRREGWLKPISPRRAMVDIDALHSIIMEKS